MAAQAQSGRLPWPDIAGWRSEAKKRGGGLLSPHSPAFPFPDWLCAGYYWFCCSLKKRKKRRQCPRGFGPRHLRPTRRLRPAFAPWWLRFAALHFLELGLLAASYSHGGTRHGIFLGGPSFCLVSPPVFFTRPAGNPTKPQGGGLMGMRDRGCAAAAGGQRAQPSQSTGPYGKFPAQQPLACVGCGGKGGWGALGPGVRGWA
jgi:hypothetical protein